MARSHKRELPLQQDADVERLVGAFEALTFPREHWTHRAHLAVAVTSIRHDPVSGQGRGGIETAPLPANPAW
jgi:hypothetical protein